MICPVCGNSFEPSVPYQKYCSKKCSNTAVDLHNFNGVDYIEREPFEFDCAHCGKHVKTAPLNDRRFRFCSKQCERRYWRHPPKNCGDNLGMSGGMSLNSLIRRERRDLD